MKMSDLQAKDIVNVTDGKRIGRITDIVVSEKGEIMYLIIEPTKLLKRYTSIASETSIKFEQIVKFGTDVILVDLKK